MNNILIKPHLTEKTIALTTNHGYTFEVLPSATKSQIKEVVSRTFKVHVTKLTTKLSHVPGKRSATRRSTTNDRLVKYATVYLKKGETISLFEFKDSAAAGQK